MSRIERPHHPAFAPRPWKPALPLLGLALTAAMAFNPAVATAADTPAPVWKQHITLTSGSGMPYAFVREGERGISMSGSDADLDAIRAARTRLGGEFLWFRDGGKAYVVQDAATLAQARAAWTPLDRMGAQMDTYDKQMRRHAKAMETVGKDMEVAGHAMAPDEGSVRDIERRMGDVGRRMGEVGRQMGEADDAGQPRLQRRMAVLQRQMDDLAREMAAATRTTSQRAAQASMKNASLRMQDAQQPVKALSVQMGELGKDMARESAAAERTMRALIRDAQAKGLARPAPQA